MKVKLNLTAIIYEPVGKRLMMPAPMVVKSSPEFDVTAEQERAIEKFLYDSNGRFSSSGYQMGIEIVVSPTQMGDGGK